MCISGFALAMGLAAVPALSAQSRGAARAEIFVCRDGSVMQTYDGPRVCARHRGLDHDATVRARRDGISGGYDANGVYDSNRSVYNNGGVYDGGVYNGGVYNGGVYNGGVYNGGVYNGGVYDGSVYGTPGRGVYDGNGSVYGQTNGGRSVYGGVDNGTSRSVYGGTVSGTNNGMYDRDDDGDHDGGHGRGHAYGHDKHQHHHGDQDGDT